MKREFTVTVTQTITVRINDELFTPDWMQEFRDYMYDFETLEDHIKHLAGSFAAGLIQYSDDFVEGYGRLDEYETELILDDFEVEIEKEE